MENSSLTKEELMHLLRTDVLEFNRVRPINLDLSGANLKQLDLKHVDLSNAILSLADLEETNLKYANFKCSDLSYANLSGAFLKYTIFKEANLKSVSLKETIWNCANLTRAKNIIPFKKVEGRQCYAVVHNTCIMVQAGCFWGKLSEFEKACKREYPDNPIKAYEIEIEYLRKLERLYIKK